MTIEDLVKRSLNKIEAPTTRKKAMLNTILEQMHSKDETGVRKVRIAKPKNFILVSAAVAAAAIVAVLLITMQPTSLPEAAIVQTPKLIAQEQEAGEYGDPSWLKNLVLSPKVAQISFPEEIVLYEDIPIEISDEELVEIEQNLLANGWQDTKGMTTDTGGLYFMSRSDGEPILMTEPTRHETMAQVFMEESGLGALLQSKGMTVEMEAKQPPANVTETTEVGQAETILWSMVDGIRSSGFVRLSVTADKHVPDCKIFAVKSVAIEQVQTLPLSKAIENAFIPGGIGMPRDGNIEYTVIDAELVYKHGVPFYELTLLIDEDTKYHPTAYALAVDKEAIDRYEASAAAYAAFVNEGV